MSAYQSSLSRISRAPADRNNRRSLIKKNPPAWQCLIVFGALVCVSVAVLFFALRHEPRLAGWPAVPVLAISFAWVVIRATRPRQPGEPVRGLFGYAVIGVLTGGVCIGASLMGHDPSMPSPVNSTSPSATSSGHVLDRADEGTDLTSESTAEPNTLLSEDVPVTVDPDNAPPPDRQEHKADPDEDARDTDDPENTTEVNVAAAVAVVSEPASEPEIAITQTPPVEKALHLESTIPLPRSRILPAGTRLEWNRLNSNTIEVRLEERADRFVSGLLKTDFRLQTEAGEPLPFDLTEALGRDIAVRSSVAIVIDENLSMSLQQLELREALDAVLRNSTYAGYRLVSAGRSLRTLVDWTSNPALIRAAVPQFRQSQGNAFPVAVSLNLNELSKRSHRRILILVTNTTAVLAKDPSMLRRLQDSRTDLVIIGEHRSYQTTHPLDKAVVGFNELHLLGQTLRSLTVRREAPSYRIENIDLPSGSDMYLTVGSGDSAATAIIPWKSEDESATANPSR